MKILEPLIYPLITGLVFMACSNNHDMPEPVNEEEVITTMTVTLSRDAGADVVVLTKFDPDGDGPDTPEVSVSGNLVAEAVYTGSIELLNETKNPAAEITTEVLEENTKHQFFYNADVDLEVTTEYRNTDDDGNPLGTEFMLTAGMPSSGTLTITLRHEPKKPNDGTLADAGGETDVDATFKITVE